MAAAALADLLARSGGSRSDTIASLVRLCLNLNIPPVSASRTVGHGWISCTACA